MAKVDECRVYEMVQKSADELESRLNGTKQLKRAGMRPFKAVEGAIEQKGVLAGSSATATA